jgi:hypothetical protein
MPNNQNWIVAEILRDDPQQNCKPLQIFCTAGLQVGQHASGSRFVRAIVPAWWRGSSCVRCMCMCLTVPRAWELLRASRVHVLDRAAYACLLAHGQTIMDANGKKVETWVITSKGLGERPRSVLCQGDASRVPHAN